jgi:hypothetical protein
LETGELCPRGVDVRLACEAMFMAVLGQFGDFLLRGDEIERDLPRNLRRPKLQIGLRDLRFERHQQIVARLDRAGALRIGRLDLASHLAEQIDLPGGIESQLPQVDGLLERPDQLLRLARGRRTGLADSPALEYPGEAELLARVRCGGTEPGQSLRASRLHLDARRDDPQVRRLEIEIPRRCMLDQLVEFGVLELAPPERRRFLFAGEPRARIMPGHGLVRRLVVRSHLAGLQGQGGERRGRDGSGAAHQWAAAAGPPAFFTPEKKNVNGTNANASSAQYRNTSLYASKPACAIRTW